MAPGESENNNNAVQKVPIVNALLTFTAAIFRNSSYNRIVPLLTSHFDLTEVKDAKNTLCNEVQKQFQNKKSSAMRSEKTAHVIDICDIFREIDVTDMPLFVMDSVSFASLPRINAEDVSYVAVADKLADIVAKIDLMNDSIATNAARSIANADRIQNMNNLNIDAPYKQRWSRQAPFTIPPPISASTSQSNYRLGGITDMSYAGQLKIPRMQPTNINSSPRMQRPPQVNKSVPNVVSTESHASGATNDPASVIKEVQHPIPPQQPDISQGNTMNNNQQVETADITEDAAVSATADATETDSVQQTNLDMHGTGDTQQDAHRNNDKQNNDNGASGIPNSVPNKGDDQNAVLHVRGVDQQQHSVNVDRMTNGTQGSISHMPTNYTSGATDDAKGWTLPPKHARKLDRFLNKNSVHGTAISTKVKGATAPPDELFISRVDGDTTEADMAEYILELGVHIIDLELTSHIEARNKSFKLTVNKPDFYKLLDASLWPDGVKVGRYRKPRNIREYRNTQYH